MRRKESEPLEKRIVNFYQGDFQTLQELHPRLGASKAVRTLVRAHIKRAKEAMMQKASPVRVEGIDLP